MTVQDLIDLLTTLRTTTTLTDLAITRVVLLAYEMGMQAGRAEAHAHTKDTP